MEKDNKNINEKNIEGIIDDLVKKAQVALDEMMKLNQEDIDKIIESMAKAGMDNHIKLAKMAVEETKKGVFEDKITKNIFSTEFIYNDIKYKKTVGIIEENDEEGFMMVAEPIGVVAGVTPVTNPTSTTMFKSLISIKGRNPIIFSFHPSAQKCSEEAAKIIRDFHNTSYRWSGYGEICLFIRKTSLGSWSWKCSLFYRKKCRYKRSCK